MEVKGIFEEDRRCSIRDYKVSGTTVKRQLYPSDEKERYFHIYYNESKRITEREKKDNYMTVPAAIKELEKIEMIRLSDGNYRLEHAVTSTQKEILKAFNLTGRNVQEQAIGINEELRMIRERK